MREQFCQAMITRLDPLRSVFLTGDLGFMALEALREQMGTRFINAGIAEQNMISVAAGLARSGVDPWVYSIAPFCYARPFEQIRNDVCLHKMPVRLVGNGGGYGYGVMGSSHHAIEDYGALLTLQGMCAYIPAFDEDVDPIVVRMQQSKQPGYLRLGRSELPAGVTAPAYAPWRKLTEGNGPLLVLVGPLAGSHLREALKLDYPRRPQVWVVSELPIDDQAVPEEFRTRLRAGADLWVVEEHVAQGGFGQALASYILREGLGVGHFHHRAAQGYPSGRAGSQNYHRRESGIDAEGIARLLIESSV